MKPQWSALAAGLWSGRADSVDWPRLGQAALERDVLGALDLKLIRLLAARAACPGDGALLSVLGCLLATVRAGGLRIPAEPGALAGRLEAFLRSLHAGAIAAPPAGGGKEADGAATSAALAAPDLAGMARGLAERFHQGLDAGAYAGIVGGPADFKPLLYSGRNLYFQKYHAAEALAGNRLAALLSAPDRPVDPASERNILDTVLRRFPMRRGKGPGAVPLDLAPEQVAALSLGLRKRLLVVSGGPGTGKTTLVANLLRALVRLSGPEGRPTAPWRIRLAAPTGRAAQRLTESLRAGLGSIAPADPAETLSGTGAVTAMAGTAVAGTAMDEAALDAGLAGLEGETLHRLLRYQPSRGEYFHRKGRPVPADLVVVDEASMIDIFALARLLDALEDGAGLVLLGDMDQLPSVEAGAVLADLMPWQGKGAEAGLAASGAPGPVAVAATGPLTGPLAGHLVRLERSHRSGAGILEVTREINAQRGEAALAAMARPAVLGMDPAPWPAAFPEGGPAADPGGSCRLIQPAQPAQPSRESDPRQRSAEPGQAAFSRGLPALLQSWASFHYLAEPPAPALPPGRAAAGIRRAYADLIAALSASAPESVADGSADWAGDGSGKGTDAVPAAWLEDLRAAFACLDRGRILTFTRRGWHGSLAVNRHLRETLAPAWDAYGGPSGSEGFNGAPILILENAYAQDLFNGEVGLMLRVRGRYLVFFRKEEGFRPYPASFLPRHELAFATTVHKAQGSEYDQVLILLPEAGNRLLLKETLYTAITRARRFAGLYGPRETFLEAVGRRTERESGLREYLPGPASA